MTGKTKVVWDHASAQDKAEMIQKARTVLEPEPQEDAAEIIVELAALLLRGRNAGAARRTMEALRNRPGTTTV